MSDLHHYHPSRDADLLLVQAWARMDADGDLDRIFSDPTIGIADFLQCMKPPHETVFAADHDGIYFLVWLEVFMCGAFLSAYFRPDRRLDPAVYALFHRVLGEAVARHGTILNLTWQEHLLPIHRMMGYESVGRIPGLFRGRDALVFSCNADSFAQATTKWSAVTTPPIGLSARERCWLTMLRQQEG